MHCCHWHLQVFTAVLMHYTRDQLPFTMFADSKVPNDIWGKNNGEAGSIRSWCVGCPLLAVQAAI